MSLILKDLSKSFDVNTGVIFGVKGKVQALKNVNAELEVGGSLGVVGESGSGKTTLAKILAGFLDADAGSAEFDGHNLLTVAQKNRAKLVQMVFQDPFASLNPKLLLHTQLQEAITVIPAKAGIQFSAIPFKKQGQGLDSRLRGNDGAVKLMSQVGLSQDFLNRYPHQLSGGQRQRFAIARALAVQPKLLIADEPVSNLDLSVQAQIINLLNSLRKELKFTLITISHDLAVIANLCEQVIVMKEGVVQEKGPVEKVLSNPESPYTKRLLSATPVV